MKKYRAFAKRFCTYCGTYELLYIEYEPNKIIGLCSCGNTDYCDNTTKEDILKEIGKGFYLSCNDIIIENN